MRNSGRLVMLAAVSLGLCVRGLKAQPEAPKAEAPKAEAEAPKAEAPHAEASHAEGEASSADFVGADTCLGCHADHEGFKKNIHAKSLPSGKGIEFSKTCETCHGPGGKHASAGGDKANPDFHTIRNPGALTGEHAAEVCLKCHSGGKRMHWDGSVHESKGVVCQSCHSMHNEKANKGRSPLLKREGPDMNTCFQCHPDKRAQIRKSAHMPLEEGKMGCTSCHNPHGSTEERLMAKSSVMETCYQCHADKRGPFLWEHPPARENCLNCHNPHGSHNDKMLVSKAPILCQRCHGGTKHPSQLYDGLQAMTESSRVNFKGCVNCHSRVHGSNHPSGKWLIR